MKNIQKAIFYSLLAWLSGTHAEEISKLDFDWRFHKGDQPGAEQVGFDDAKWRTLDIPHDWSIEDLDAKTLLKEKSDGSKEQAEPRQVGGPFDSWAPNGTSMGYARSGIGWYRKTFSVPESWADKRIEIQFDGVYMNAEVWLNGRKLGRHPYGYTSFTYDLTEALNAPGTPNVLAVKVANIQPNTRWYSGSGIYRHVWLKAFNPVHIANWGVGVTTPKVSRDVAEVRVETTLENETDERVDATLETVLLDPDGQTVASLTSTHRVATGIVMRAKQPFVLPRPKLWEPESPALYTAVSTVRIDGKVVDERQTTFGIRSIEFNADNGFLLNGHPMLLKGACIHHDNGPLGAAAYDRAEERKIELLKAAGFNAVRLSHNPPSEALLEACDRLGILVIDEIFDYWDLPKKNNSYHLDFPEYWEKDLEAMVLRDRNHPSIILWSIGNEINEQYLDHGAQWARTLADKTRTLDPSRPVTSALCRIVGVEIDWPTREPFMSALDVTGYNYKLEFYEESHAREPTRVIMSSESRGREAFDYWMAVEDNPYIVGDFVWTGMDYIGEIAVGWAGFTSARKYPWTLAYCGDLDLCGFKRDAAYYRNVLWGDKNVYPLVHNPDPTAKFGTPYMHKWGYEDKEMNWTWPDHKGEKLIVEVASRSESVRLLVNGKDYGLKKPTRETEFKAVWENVEYQPGWLTAIGYDGAVENDRRTIQTVGAPKRIRLTADRDAIAADGQDLVYVTVEVVDENGLRVPSAKLPVTIEVGGAGTLAGFGSGNPKTDESFQQPVRTTFEGRALAIVKAGKTPGPITLLASAPGLERDSVKVDAE